MASQDPHNLQRFVDAQEGVIDDALSELAAGSKRSHWTWFIFPQLAELGHSPTAKFYGLTSLEEAQAYLRHSVLRPRLKQCIEALLPWARKRSAEQILGPIDSMKLCSSMTLFDSAEPDGLFAQALVNFFAAERDQQTLALLERRR